MCTRHTDRSEEIVVLHVDDQPELTETVATLVEREDERLVVETATSVREALDALQKQDFDCIVSDYDMPGRNGIEFLEIVREEHPRLPFVLYTGKGSEEIASEAISAGVTDYLQKGADASQYTVLANRVTNAVATYRTRERAETMHRIQRIQRKVNQQLVHAQTRPEIESAVCRIISRFEPYRLVWIGSANGDHQAVRSRARAGDAIDYLDGVSLGGDRDEAEREPAVQALDREKLVVIEPGTADSGTDTWQAAARKHGIRAVAAIPLVHDGTQYGVVSVYSERSGFFDEHERSLLTTLGEDIAHAMYRVDNEQALRDKQAHLRLYKRAVESSNDLLAGIDTEYTLIFANERYRTFHGIDEADIGDISLPDVLGKTWDEEIKQREDRVLEGEILRYEVERTSPDGERRTFSVQDYPLKDTDGTILGVVGSMRDITERKDQERELRTLSERLDLAVEAANIGVWDWNVRTDAVQFNEQWARMLGDDPANVEPHRDAWERRIHPDDLPTVRATLQAHLADETDQYECEFRMRTADGSWKWVHDIGRVIRRDENGDPIRAVGVQLDIDDRRRDE